MKPFVQRLPNYITFFRLALIPVFVCLMLDPDPTGVMPAMALIVFIIASVTDSIDGWMARRYGAVSDFGKLLDPIVDKILVMAALVMLVAQKSENYGESWAPGWMVVLVLARETWVNGLRSVAAARGLVVAANRTGKLKSFLQMVAIGCLLLHGRKIPLGAGNVPWEWLGVRLLLISIAISYLGALQYSWIVLSESREKEPAPAPAVSPPQPPVGESLQEDVHKTE